MPLINIDPSLILQRPFTSEYGPFYVRSQQDDMQLKVDDIKRFCDGEHVYAFFRSLWKPCFISMA